MNGRHPCRYTYPRQSAGYPPPLVQATCRLILSYRIAPLAIMGGTVRPGPARVKGGLRRRSAIEEARPWDPHRTKPKVGSYRGDAGGLPAALTRSRQLP
ncbi:MAG: hypothetical protein QOF10_2300 [Kribbellaceae bacterium]|nr:hypothetical protein [Kribbellaceae bacterium]